MARLSGAPTLINSVLFIAPGVTNRVSFTFNGPFSRLIGDVVPEQFLRAEGTLRDGPSVLASATGFRNAGTISLDSTDFPASASLIVTQGAITNLASGIIDVRFGAGGEREIDADLINFGKLRIGAGCTIAPASGGFTNEGLVSIDPDQTLIVQSNYLQGSAASVAIGLSQPQIDFPQESIEVSGTAQLDGQLQIILAEGFSPAPLDEFVLLRSKALSGYFSSAVLPPLSDGMFWNINYTTNAVILSLGDSFTAPALNSVFCPLATFVSFWLVAARVGAISYKLPRICWIGPASERTNLSQEFSSLWKRTLPKPHIAFIESSPSAKGWSKSFCSLDRTRRMIPGSSSPEVPGSFPNDPTS